MIVVAVLLLVVLTMSMRFLLDVLNRQQSGVAGKRATERTIVSLDQMGQDFRSAISHDRATGGGLGLDDLGFVASGYVPSGSARAAYVNDRLDIIAASQWAIQLRVPSSGGTNCVTYSSSLAARGKIERIVSKQCPATTANTISRSTVVDARPVGARIYPPFSYTMLSTASGCPAVAVPATATFDALSGQGSMQTLNRLASVRVDLRATAMSGRNAATSIVQTEFVFRSRMSAPYRRALGGDCAT